jgi:hypothetical protein
MLLFLIKSFQSKKMKFIFIYFDFLIFKYIKDIFKKNYFLEIIYVFFKYILIQFFK